MGKNTRAQRHCEEERVKRAHAQKVRELKPRSSSRLNPLRSLVTLASAGLVGTRKESSKANSKRW